jgi:hypothetical protein
MASVMVCQRFRNEMNPFYGSLSNAVFIAGRADDAVPDDEKPHYLEAG